MKNSCDLLSDSLDVAGLMSVLSSQNISDKAASALTEKAVDSGFVIKSEVKNSSAAAGATTSAKSAEDTAVAVLSAETSNPEVDLEFTEVDKLRVSNGMIYDTERASASNAYIGVNRSDAKYDKTKNIDAFSKAGRAIVTEEWNEASEDTVAYCEFVPGVSDVAATANRVAKVLRAGGRVLMPSIAEINAMAREHYKQDAARKAFHKGWTDLFEMLGAMGFSNAQADRTKGMAATVWEETETRSYTPVGALSAQKLQAVGDAKVNTDEIVSKAKSMTVKAPPVESGDALDKIASGEINCIVKTDSANNKYSELKDGDIIAIGSAKRKVYVRVVNNISNVDSEQCSDLLNPENGLNSGLSAEVIAGMKNTASDGTELTRSILQIEPLVDAKAGEKTNRKSKRAKKRKSGGKSGVVKAIKEGFQTLAEALKGKREGGSAAGDGGKDGSKDDGDKDKSEAQKKAKGPKYKKLKEGSAERAKELLRRRDKLVKEADKFLKSLGVPGYNAELQEIDRELAVLGMANEDWIYASEHSPLVSSPEGRATEEGDALDKVFGSFKEAQIFCETVSTFFYRFSESVIEAKIGEYERKLEELHQALASTPEDKLAERAGIRADIAQYAEWLAILRDESWTGAHKVPDVMTTTLHQFVEELNKCNVFVFECTRLMEADPSMDMMEAMRLASQSIGYPLEQLQSAHIFKLINYALNNDTKFFEKILPKDLLTIDEEVGNGEDDIRDSLDDDAKEALRKDDEKLLADRVAKRQIMELLVTRMLTHLSTRINTKISFKNYHTETYVENGHVKLRFVGAAGRSKAKTDENGLDVSDEVEEGEDDIKEKESGLEEHLFHAHDRSTHETISQLVRRFLASVPLFTVTSPSRVNPVTGEKIPAQFEAVRDKYNISLLAPPNMLYSKLMTVFAAPGAMKSSDDMVRYFEEHQESEPIYHGVLWMLERFPQLKSHLFNAFNKRATKMRVLTNSALIYGSEDAANSANMPSMIGQVKNYDENVSYVAGMIQQVVSTGVVLLPGRSVYDVDGKVNEDGAKRLYHELFEKTEKVTETEDVAATTGQKYTRTHRETTYKGALVDANFSASRVPQLIAEDDPTLRAFHTLLRGIGVDCEYEDMKAAFATHPKLMSVAFSNASQLLKNIARPEETKGLSAHTKYAFGNGDNLFLENSAGYERLAKALVGLSRNTVDSMANILGSRKFSYANRDFIDDLVDNIGTMSDEELLEYFEREYLHVKEGSSYMYSEVGKEVLCGWIRDLLASKELREMFLAGYDANCGVDYGGDSDGRNREYQDMTAAERVMIELNNYFFPTHEKQSVMKNVTIDGVSHSMAKYSTPIHADSNNHVFLPNVRFTDSDVVGDLKDPDHGKTISLSSHSPKGLLWRLALVVMADYRRICAVRSISDEALKGEYGKWGKKARKFTAFPAMNSISVTMEDGTTLSIEKFLDYAEMSEAADMEIVPKSISLNGRTFTMPQVENEDITARDVLMYAIEEFVLKEYYDKAMARWESLNVFATDGRPGDFKYLPDQYSRDDKVLDQLRYQLNKRAGLYEKMVKLVCPPNMTFALSDDGSDVIIVAANAAAPQTKKNDKDGDDRWKIFWQSLTPEQRKFIYSMRDRHFLEDVMFLPLEERKAEKQRLMVSVWGGIIEALKSPQVNGGETDKAKTLAATDFGQSLERAFDSNIEDSMDNKLVLAMREYVWNTTYARTQMTMLFHGDCAPFKNIGEKSKRDKGNKGASEKVDQAAIDPFNDNRPVIDYYGDDRLADVLPGWDKSCQRAIYITDLESRIGKDGKTYGFPNLSQYWNDTLQPKLAREFEAAEKYRAEQSALLSRGIISPEEYERRVAGLITSQDYADFCSGFGGMCASDGQSFRTLESMRKFLLMLSQWTHGHEELYTRLMKGEKVSVGEVRDALQQMKTFCYGHEDVRIPDGHGGTYTVRLSQFIKDSEACLFMYTEEFQKVMGEDSWLVGVLQAAREHHIDTIHFDSAVKLGGHHSIDITQARNAAEAKAIVDRHLAAEGEGRQCDYIHAIPWSCLGKQVPTPPHLADQKVAMGIQAMKILASDIPPTTKYIGPDGKIHERPTVIKIRDSDGNVRYTLTAEQYKDLYKRIQVTDIMRAAAEVDERFKDKASISRLLIESIDATDKYPENLKWAVSINPDTGDFNVPLDDPVIFNAVQSIVSSVVRKNIVKRKIRGGTAVQFTSVGLSSALRVVTRKDEETGMEYALYAEARLPAWSKSLFKAYADENGEIDFDKIPDRLKEMVGYRVPTEHLYSIVPIKIVGFLDEAGGTSVMLPQEIVAWSGSDFDIDKLFLSMFDFNEVTDDNFMRVVPDEVWEEYYKVHPEVLERINRAWEADIEETLKGAEGEDKEEGEEVRRMMADPQTRGKALALYRDAYGREKGLKGRVRPFDILDVDDRRRLNDDFRRFAKERGLMGTTELIPADIGLERHVAEYEAAPMGATLGEYLQNVLDSASHKELMNLLLELQRARLCSDFSFDDINRPGGFMPQKKMERIISIIRNISQEGLGRLMSALGASSPAAVVNILYGKSIDELDDMASEYVEQMDLMEQSADAVLFERNMVGKKMIGIFALNNSLHSLLQEVPRSLSDAAVEHLPFVIGGKTLRSISGIYDEDGGYICINFARYLGASTDNAKDPVIDGLNVNPITANVMTTMLHLGYSNKSVSLFLSQPIVRALVKKCKAEGVSLGKALSEFMDAETASGYRSQTGLTHEVMASELASTHGDDIKALLKSPAQVDALVSLYSLSQVSNVVSGIMNATKLDSPKNSIGNDYGNTYSKMAAVKRLPDMNMIKRKIDGKWVRFQMFDGERSMTSIVSDSFDIGQSESPGVDEYMSGSAMPVVQAYYDFGFKRPLSYMASLFGMYSPKVLGIVDAFNRMSTFAGAFQIDEKMVNTLLHDYQMFVSIGALAREEGDVDNHTLSEIRHAWLSTFPNKYAQFLESMRDKGRNAREEFSLLSHIARVPANKRTKKDKFLLRFVSSARVDKDMQNEIINSWRKMASDSDPEVRAMASHLFVYSMMLDGCAYSPSSFGTYCPYEIKSKYEGYMDALRNIGNGLDESMEKRFLDQFIRNHYASLPRHCNVLHNPRACGEFKKTFFNKESGEYAERIMLTELPGFMKQNEAMFSYVAMPSGGKVVMYRVTADPNGETYVCEKCEPLGDKLFREYDPETDLNVSTPIGYTDLNASNSEHMRLIVDNREERALEQMRKEVADEVVSDLTRLQATMHRKGDDGGLGNSSTAYVVDEHGNEAMRVHTFIHDEKQEEMDKLIRQQKKKKDFNQKNKRDFTDEELEVIMGDRATLGSLVDEYVRLYFEMVSDGEGWSEERKMEQRRKMDALMPSNRELIAATERFNSLSKIAQPMLMRKVNLRERYGRYAKNPLKGEELERKVQEEMANSTKEEYDPDFLQEYEKAREELFRLKTLRESVETTFSKLGFVYKDKDGDRLLPSFRDSLEAELDRIAERFRKDGDTVITSLGGSLMVWAQCMTKDGPKRIGGELDMLVRHKDGTFSIYDMKTMTDSGYNEISRKESHGRYLRYQRQLNTYAAILRTRYPDIEIRDMRILPIVIPSRVADENGSDFVDGNSYRYVRKAKLGADGKALRDEKGKIVLEEGQRIKVERPRFEFRNDGTVNDGTAFTGGEIVIDPTDVGIIIPSRTERQAAREAEARAAAQAITDAEANGDVETFTALGKKYLGNLGEEYENVWGPLARLDDTSYNPNSESTPYSETKGAIFSPILASAKKSEMYKKVKEAGFTIEEDTRFALVLNKLVYQGKAEGSAVKALYDAIKSGIDVRDDDGNIIC